MVFEAGPQQLMLRAMVYVVRVWTDKSVKSSFSNCLCKLALWFTCTFLAIRSPTSTLVLGSLLLQARCQNSFFFLFCLVFCFLSKLDAGVCFERHDWCEGFWASHSHQSCGRKNRRTAAVVNVGTTIFLKSSLATEVDEEER